MAAPPPSLDELLKGVPPEKLDKPCRDSHLHDLSLKVADWKFIAPFIHISEVVQREIESEGSVGTQRVAMLRRWKMMYGKEATYRKLATVFWKLRRADLVDEVRFVLTNGDSSSRGEVKAPAVLDVHSSILDLYADHLRCKYRKEFPTFTQWPPPPTRKFFNLAMIHRTPIQVGPVDDKHIRLTQMGNVESIMLNKTAILLKDIFHVPLQSLSDPVRRTVILAEGAPGAGKSTLAWYICEQWGLGNLFGEFKLVVFVQLRSPAVQSAMSIADLLPRTPDGIQQEVLRNLRACHGSGILFIFDGWDEFNGGLTEESICRKLICNPGELYMQESALLVTSRPVASGELQPYCSSRIEIIGFHPNELEAYFKQVLSVAYQGEQQAEVLQQCLNVRPVIQASCYLPLNAAIVAHLFMAEGNTLPTTLHGLFTSLVLNLIVRHLRRTRREEGTCRSTQVRINSFETIPAELQRSFKAVCALACYGIIANKASFSEERLHSFQLSTESSAPLLSLIQGWSTLASSCEQLLYSFFHLSVQELLAAYHISTLKCDRQIELFSRLFGKPRFATVLYFYAAFTKLEVVGIRNFIKCRLRKSVSVARAFCTDRSRQMPKVELHKTILDCLYEAQDPELCQYVAAVMEGRLTVDYSLSPLHCMVIGYFLHCLCLIPGGGKFHIELATSDLDEYKCCYLINELKKCTYGKLALSLGESVHGRSLTVLVPMLQESCSHCVSYLSLSVDGRVIHLWEGQQNSQLEALAALMAFNSNVKVLNISNYELKLTDIEALADSLSTNSALETLRLSSCTISVESVTMLAYYLANNTTLTSLHLSESMPPVGLVPMADSVAINTTLRSLDLSDCTISSEGLLALAKCLARNSALEELNLSCCKLNAKQNEKFTNPLREPALRALDLGCTLDLHLFNDLTDSPTIEALTLAPQEAPSVLMNPNFTPRVPVINPVVQALAVSLGRNRTLKCLNLSFCWIAREIVPLLFVALAPNKTLETLVLAWNDLDCNDLDDVICALRLNSGLKELDISGCGVGRNSPSRLQSILTTCQSLERLKISENDLSCTHAGRTGAHYLAQGLRQNRSLRSLSIAGCRLTDRTMGVIVEALKDNPLLQELDFSGNFFTDSELRKLKERLKEVRSLRKVTPCLDTSV